MPSTVRATQSDVAIRKCTGAEAHPAGCARLPALYRGTRQTGRSRLTQLQNHVSWDGAEAGVLPASRLSSPAGAPQTGPSAGHGVARSRPGAEVHNPARGDRSRSTLQACLPERRPSIERDSLYVIETETDAQLSA